MKLKTYTPEFRAEAVKVLLAQGLSLAAAQRLVIPKGTLANWVSAAKRNSDLAAAPGSRSICEMKAEVVKLRKELAVERFEISRSGFYSWQGRPPSAHAQDDERLKVAIKAAHTQTRETYGVPRLWPELRAQGFETRRDRVVRLRRELGLRCRQKRKFKATTNSRYDFPIAENLLNQTFTPARPNEVWVTDITYILTDEGWLYLAGVKDVFTCELVGYAMGGRMTQQDLTQYCSVRPFYAILPPSTFWSEPWREPKRYWGRAHV